MSQPPPEFDADALNAMMAETGMGLAGGLLRDMYLSWVRAGFTEQQATYFAGIVVAAGNYSAQAPGGTTVDGDE